jgi:hypothetical protein
MDIVSACMGTSVVIALVHDSNAAMKAERAIQVRYSADNQFGQKF